jgi:hypothetical protein
LLRSTKLPAKQHDGIVVALSFKEVQSAIESFGADIQEDPEKKDLQQRESELVRFLQFYPCFSHHPYSWKNFI